MKSNINLIDEIIPTDITRRNVRTIIPILIRWAQLGRFHQHYEDLIKLMGYTIYPGIGRALGATQEVIDELSKRTSEKIPSLNSLCKSKQSDLPSKGFDFVDSNYTSWKAEVKIQNISKHDVKAHLYQKWDWVLGELGLEPYKPLSEDELEHLKTYSMHGGGEGPEHKTLKEFIYSHPESINIHGVIFREMEYSLPSGDRLDVYFETKDGRHIAVEIKSKISSDEDINRGIFQCIKYKSVLLALRRLECKEYQVESLLVTERELSNQNKIIAEELDVSVTNTLLK